MCRLPVNYKMLIFSGNKPPKVEFTMENNIFVKQAREVAEAFVQKKI